MAITQSDVAIESYVVFDNNDDCATADSMCERMIQAPMQRTNFRKQFASIYGSATTVHDIMLSDYYLMPAVDESQGGDESEDEDMGRSCRQIWIRGRRHKRTTFNRRLHVSC